MEKASFSCLYTWDRRQNRGKLRPCTAASPSLDRVPTYAHVCIASDFYYSDPLTYMILLVGSLWRSANFARRNPFSFAPLPSYGD